MSKSLRDEVAAIDWYHTIELAPGVETPGWFDQRSILDQIPFPASLAGKRCLDVATFNGFWAFEMERRGADEVIGIDVLRPDEWDWPAGSVTETVEIMAARQARGEGFEIAKRELGSSVRRLERNVYDLDESHAGRFDVVFVGSLLLHLRDPVRALERVRGVCDGTLILVEAVDLSLALRFRRRPVAGLDGRGRPWWWFGNDAAVARMVEVAGFEVLGQPSRLYMPPGRGQPVNRWRLGDLRTRPGRLDLTIAWRGDPHTIVRARPRALPAD